MPYNTSRKGARVSQEQILVLGAIAGLTIFIGLPAGRLRRMSSRTSALLSAVATGILLFLLWDVLAAGIEPVEAALNAAAIDHEGTWARFAGLAAIFVGCFLIGLMSLVYFDQLIAKRRRKSGFLSLGAAAIAEYEVPPHALSPAQSLSLMIATGIGLHNFSEGLAIGQSAASGAINLALVLVIGFGLHNATEGFGIVGPFSGTQERPSWSFLALVGLIGGAPTFFGTLIGQAWVSEAVSIAFLAVAAGSILYVVVELLGVCRNLGYKTVVAWGLALGLMLGFATDFVLVAAGA
jgi:ZIP family zinc transporter